MKKIISFFLAFLLLIVFTSAQTPHLPRDPDKLISRAQAYWTYIVSGQKLKALDLVLPEKKDAFLASTNALVLDARVESLNLTDDIQHASVRIQLHTVQPGSMGKDLQEFTQNWIWKAGKPKVAGGPAIGNWYLDVSDPKGLPIMSGGNKPGIVTENQKYIDEHLTLPEPILNIGTVTKGGPDISIDVPVAYSGDKPLVVELATPYPGFSVNPVRGGLASQSKHFTVSFDTSEYENAMAVPLHIRFAYQGAIVERVITVQVNVFAPITFRQDPIDGPAKPGDHISVFIKNNTADPIPLASVSTNDRMDMFKNVTILEPHQESEVILRLRPGVTDNVLYVVPRNPVDGVGQFAYSVRGR